MSMWMILRIRFLSIRRMLLDLRRAKDPNSIECVRLACSIESQGNDVLLEELQ